MQFTYLLTILILDLVTDASSLVFAVVLFLRIPIGLLLRMIELPMTATLNYSLLLLLIMKRLLLRMVEEMMRWLLGKKT